MALPLVSSAAELAAVRGDEARLRPGVEAILAHHHLGGAAVRFTEGSLPVYAVGEAQVLKLYPPPYLAERDTEAAALAMVAGRLPIPTPRVLHTGEHTGWGYLLMERLHGESLAAAWPRLGERDRERLAAALGEALAALHAIRHPLLETLAPADWAAFVAGQRATAVERQRARGLDAAWLAQLPAFLESLPAEPPGPRVLVHTEVMHEHLLVRQGPHGWELSGLFDFEPAMQGAPEYELASVGVFVSGGDPRLLGALLRAYGYRDGDLGEALARRLLGYAIAHR